jgi:hypothetical protein
MEKLVQVSSVEHFLHRERGMVQLDTDALLVNAN